MQLFCAEISSRKQFVQAGFPPADKYLFDVSLKDLALEQTSIHTLFHLVQ